MDKRKVIFYLTIVFVISLALQGIVYLRGGVNSKDFPWLAQSLMWVPGIVAICMRIFTREGFKNAGLKWGKMIYYPLAIFLPLLISLIYIFFSLKFGLSSFNFELINFKDGLVSFGKGIGLVLGTNSQPVYFFVFNFILSILVGSILASLFTAGEELGWRSYLLPKLVNLSGLTKGIILSGLIWGYWHFPIILMGYNFPHYPLLGAFILMPVSTLFLGTISAFLYFKSKSLFPSVFFHSSVNLCMGLSEGLLLSRNLWMDLLHLSIWGGFAVLLFWKLKKVMIEST
jgi:membrane protease YdiL (CAAX protease family)